MGCYVFKQNQNHNSHHFKYQLQSEHKIEGIFYTLAINSTNNLLAVGQDSEIRIFNFKNGIIKQSQIILLRGYNMSLLAYFKKNPFFISAQINPSLVIWNSCLIQNPKFIMKLFGHSQQITSMVIHPQFQDLFITGSKDNNIKFWSFNNSWICKQTISEHTKQVICLILNQEGNQLISCSQDKSVLVIQGSNNTTWQIKQKIQMTMPGQRLSFLTNNIFIFQPSSIYDGTHLLIFKINPLLQQYEKLCQISVKGRKEYCYQYFPASFIQSKNLLLIKNGCFVNLLKIIPSISLNDIHYSLQQTIEFQTKYINGTLSQDGEFLIIWDEESEQIQIRKLIQL